MNDFFAESREQSLVKSAIVSKYFSAWAKVIISTQKSYGTVERLAYIDLFAGPGRFKDGKRSTPLQILDIATADAELSRRLVTIFNDADPAAASSLKSEIDRHPDISKLKHRPIVYNQSVGQEIVALFEKMKLVPTLFFVDPWGYKGLSLRLVNSVLKDWGCDCIFFFNYNRINMGLRNELVAEHMNALFGEERADRLRPELEQMGPMDREMRIIEELVQALQNLGGKFVLPFCFKQDDGRRTSHHLFFVSKHFRGYEIMKDVMAKESSITEQGVPRFQYCPADRKFPMLFELSRPLDELRDLLLKQFSGQQLTMLEIYLRHNVGTPYIKKNYKEALLCLEAEGAISAKPPSIGVTGEKSRRKGTFADHVVVTFPEVK